MLTSQIPDWKEKLTEFDIKPFAAASIGQVHRGVLKDGRQVAIKIQVCGLFYMSVCLSVCLYVCMLYVRIIYVRRYVCMYVCMYVRTYVRTYYVYTYTCMWVGR